jgi:metal-responsive CopG/Arc/MetJ family transcriptional regulator
MKNRRNREGVAILVAAAVKSGKAMRVNITLPEDVLAEIDRYAEDHGFTRSGFLTRAAKRALAESR